MDDYLQCCQCGAIFPPRDDVPLYHDCAPPWDGVPSTEYWPAFIMPRYSVLALRHPPVFIRSDMT